MKSPREVQLQVPFFRPSVSEAAIAEVSECLRSGWLTTGPRVKQFEAEFAEFIGARHAVAVNSCTAALHLAVEAMNLKPGQGVLVPTMTFAATAEIVLYQGGIPILVDCDPVTLNLDFDDAATKLAAARSGALTGSPLAVVGMIPVHVGGLMIDVDQIDAFATTHELWVVEDAAHALPSSFRSSEDQPWQRCGANTAAVTCYSFYANKTMTTGEGGMAVTADAALADRMRQMSLHGLSHDAWKRFQGNTPWDYQIVAPGYKYNLTDLAAAIGLHQLQRAETMRQERQEIAEFFLRRLDHVAELELPPRPHNRLHSWHLFPIRLVLDRLSLDRNAFIQCLRAHGVGCSVHWRPLHLHPYYQQTLRWRATDCPTATDVWDRLVSLPIFPGMTEAEREHVVRVVAGLCAEHALRQPATSTPRSGT
ncbi:MAG: DegT/DnrJ/EryC1/StrS family aminotransferase [Novipirellula sp. JB048]